MSLRFHYQLVPVAHPVVGLGGRFVRPRPIISVAVAGPADTRARDAILDPAADDTLFPEELARKIGVDLAHAPLGAGAGVGLSNVPLHYARVGPRISNGNEQREWQAWVGFTAVRLRYPLLGFAGFLQYFDTSFLGGLEIVELTVNSLYPGT